jgi:hypothetical protein
VCWDSAYGHRIELHFDHIVLLLLVIVNMFCNVVVNLFLEILYYLNTDFVYIKFIAYNLKVLHHHCVCNFILYRISRCVNELCMVHLLLLDLKPKTVFT